MSSKPTEKPNPVSPETLADQWSSIQTRITESIRPPALRDALSKPWVVGAVAGVVCLGVGYLIGRSRRGGGGPESQPGEYGSVDDADIAAAGRPESSQQASKAPSVWGEVGRRLLFSGVEILEAKLREAAMEEKGTQGGEK